VPQLISWFRYKIDFITLSQIIILLAKVAIKNTEDIIGLLDGEYFYYENKLNIADGICRYQKSDCSKWKYQSYEILE